MGHAPILPVQSIPSNSPGGVATGDATPLKPITGTGTVKPGSSYASVAAGAAASGGNVGNGGGALNAPVGGHAAAAEA